MFDMHRSIRATEAPKTSAPLSPTGDSVELYSSASQVEQSPRQPKWGTRHPLPSHLHYRVLFVSRGFLHGSRNYNKNMYIYSGTSITPH